MTTFNMHRCWIFSWDFLVGLLGRSCRTSRNTFPFESFINPYQIEKNRDGLGNELIRAHTDFLSSYLDPTKANSLRMASLRIRRSPQKESTFACYTHLLHFPPKSAALLAPVTFPPSPAQGAKTFFRFFKVVETEVIQNLVHSRCCSHFYHPLTKSALPLCPPFHVKIRVEENQVEVALEVVKTSLPQVQFFIDARALISVAVLVIN